MILFIKSYWKEILILVLVLGVAVVSYDYATTRSANKLLDQQNKIYSTQLSTLQNTIIDQVNAQTELQSSRVKATTVYSHAVKEIKKLPVKSDDVIKDTSNIETQINVQASNYNKRVECATGNRASCE